MEITFLYFLLKKFVLYLCLSFSFFCFFSRTYSIKKIQNVIAEIKNLERVYEKKLQAFPLVVFLVTKGPTDYVNNWRITKLYPRLSVFFINTINMLASIQVSLIFWVFFVLTVFIELRSG